MTIRFVFVGEGSSDGALVDVLEKLCLRYGAREVAGIAPEPHLIPAESRRVDDKIRGALRLEPEVHIVFVHRDADARDPEPRRAEIARAAAAVGSARPCVPVVPVQETEAWLLLDQNAIREVAENPSGRVPLDIPSPARVESVAQPKEMLDALLITASELSGRRLKRFKARLSHHRRLLLERLDIDGPVSHVPAWQQLCRDIKSVLTTLRDVR